VLTSRSRFHRSRTSIAEMICFQSYNVKSPLNARAAAWAEQNVARLPLHRGDLTVGL